MSERLELEKKERKNKKSISDKEKEIVNERKKAQELLKKMNQNLLGVENIGIRQEYKSVIENRSKLIKEKSELQAEFDDISSSLQEVDRRIKYIEKFFPVKNLYDGDKEAELEDEKISDIYKEIFGQDIEERDSQEENETAQQPNAGVDESEQENKPEIVIGRKPYIKIGDTKIRLGGLKDLYKRSDKKLLIESIGKELSANKSENEILEIYDSAVLSGFEKLVKTNEYREIVNEYIKNNSKKIDITYDLNDLSKRTFFFNKRVRQEVVDIAYNMEEKGIANVNGSFEPSVFKRLFGSMKKKLPSGNIKNTELGNDDYNKALELINNGKTELDEIRKQCNMKNISEKQWQEIQAKSYETKKPSFKDNLKVSEEYQRLIDELERGNLEQVGDSIDKLQSEDEKNMIRLLMKNSQNDKNKNENPERDNQAENER